MTQSVASQPPSNIALIDELRTLFNRGEYDDLVSRAEQLLKRKRLTDLAARNIIEAARSASLIHLGRTADAEPGLALLHAQGSNAPGFAVFGDLLKFARYYVAWAHIDGAVDAVREVSKLSGDNARLLEAQLLYRNGSYSESAAIYETLLSSLRSKFSQRQRPSAASRWSIASVTGRSRSAYPPLTAAEIQSFNSSINELATNYSAALVLSGGANRVADVLSGLPPRYELEYNAACAKIFEKDFVGAEICLEKAEALVRAELEEEEDDVEEAVAPIIVQKAYLRQLAGDVVGAKGIYTQIVEDGKADAASLAVAANNLTIAQGQLAFGKQQLQPDLQQFAASGPESSASRSTLPKEQYDALVEGLKKMRATSGKSVSRKLALSQRQAMARNRTVLLVQMGRYDACRSELAKLKTEFRQDAVVSLIEASMVARQGNLEVADKLLNSAGEGESLNAARIQLAAMNGSYDKAVSFLQQLFPNRPAAQVTAAALLEKSGNLDDAITILSNLAASTSGSNVEAAKMSLIATLLRNSRYSHAAQTLREVCNKNPSNLIALAQLAVATSYIDAEESELVVMKLPNNYGASGEIDVVQLESLPPPKKKMTAVKKDTTNEKNTIPVEKQDSMVAKQQKKKKKKKKKRLPKDYDPNDPPPDPERWLPKTLRSGYKKKKLKNDGNRFRGSQGADAASAEEAVAKNAERSATKAAHIASSATQHPGSRGKVQRKKRNKKQK